MRRLFAVDLAPDVLDTGQCAHGPGMTVRVAESDDLARDDVEAVGGDVRIKLFGPSVT